MTGHLEISGVSKKFGGIVALSDVSFDVEPGQITALIGPNGAGKTTLFNCVAGFHRIDAGSVRLNGEDITNLRPHAILNRGVARTFQLTKHFDGLTVLETVMAAGHWRSGQSMLKSIFALPSIGRSERALAQEARGTLAALGIGDLGHRYAHELPYGEQRLVEIAKAVGTGAQVLLLDEPAAGLHETEVEALFHVLRRLRERGRTILLVEHNVDLTFAVADRVAVLEFGRLIAVGGPSEIRANEEVVRSYLGTSAS